VTDLKKKRSKFIRRNRLTLLLLILVGFYFVYNMVQADQKLQELEVTKAELNENITDLEHEINRLEDEYAYSKTPEAVEKIAREKLKMVKPDEIIYLIKALEDEKKNQENGD